MDRSDSMLLRNTIGNPGNQGRTTTGAACNSANFCKTLHLQTNTESRLLRIPC